MRNNSKTARKGVKVQIRSSAPTLWDRVKYGTTILSAAAITAISGQASAHPQEQYNRELIEYRQRARTLPNGQAYEPSAAEIERLRQIVNVIHHSPNNRHGYDNMMPILDALRTIARDQPQIQGQPIYRDLTVNLQGVNNRLRQETFTIGIGQTQVQTTDRDVCLESITQGLTDLPAEQAAIFREFARETTNEQEHQQSCREVENGMMSFSNYALAETILRFMYATQSTSPVVGGGDHVQSDSTVMPPVPQAPVNEGGQVVPTVAPAAPNPEVTASPVVPAAPANPETTTPATTPAANPAVTTPEETTPATPIANPTETPASIANPSSDVQTPTLDYDTNLVFAATLGYLFTNYTRDSSIHHGGQLSFSMGYNFDRTTLAGMLSLGITGDNSTETQMGFLDEILPIYNEMHRTDLEYHIAGGPSVDVRLGRRLTLNLHTLLGAIVRTYEENLTERTDEVEVEYNDSSRQQAFMMQIGASLVWYLPNRQGGRSGNTLGFYGALEIVPNDGDPAYGGTLGARATFGTINRDQ